MNQEVFEERLEALYDKRQAIEKDIRELQKSFVDDYPIKSDDKCVDEKGTICWLCRVMFCSTYATEPTFLVNYSRKNGTRSKCGVYYSGNLTKVNSGKHL